MSETPQTVGERADVSDHEGTKESGGNLSRTEGRTEIAEARYTGCFWSTY